MKRSPRKRPNGFGNVTSLVKSDLLVWIDETGQPRSAPANKSATKLNLEKAQISRQPAKFQHRGNYEGFYWHSEIKEHVWYESMEEYTALMWLDHTTQMRAIASQPMCIMFADGSKHYPDFFALHTDGTQTLFDVRPAELIDEKARVQCEKTAAICEEIGWSYEVLTGISRIARHNLEWLAGFRRTRHQPEGDMEARVLQFLDHPRPFHELALLLDFKSPARYVHVLYNMAWNRRISFDMSQPLAETTLLWKA